MVQIRTHTSLSSLSCQVKIALLPLYKSLAYDISKGKLYQRCFNNEEQSAGEKMTENKRKHMEMIQVIISRMATISLYIKGWCITLVSALFALTAVKDTNPKVIFAAYIPAIMFWALDAYYLRQERLFRKLYDKVRTLTEETDFSMNTLPVARETASWLRVAISRTLGLFYGVIVLLISVFAFFIVKGGI
jgi:hypothetical protein